MMNNEVGTSSPPPGGSMCQGRSVTPPRPHELKCPSMAQSALSQNPRRCAWGCDNQPPPRLRQPSCEQLGLHAALLSKAEPRRTPPAKSAPSPQNTAHAPPPSHTHLPAHLPAHLTVHLIAPLTRIPFNRPMGTGRRPRRRSRITNKPMLQSSTVLVAVLVHRFP